MAQPKVVSFVARSGTGKTTFLEKLIPELVRRGLRLMVIKHDVHGFQVDREGKDTWRLRQAGAERVLIANAEQMALMGRSDGDIPLRKLVSRYASGIDLVITEGYRRSGMPKVLVAREGSPETFDPAAPEVSEAIAAVTDCPLALPPLVPQFPLDDAGPCADFLAHFAEVGAGGQAVPRELTGVILAGGASRRMGSDKAHMELDGAAVLPRLVERLAPLCSGGVLVVRRSPEQELPKLPGSARLVDDLLPEHAALGGLYTGLAMAATPFVFLTACDMPWVNPEAVAWLASRAPAGADVLLPIWEGRPQSMHAVYGHHCLAAIKEALLSGEFRMDGWHGSVRVQRVEPEEWVQVDPEGRSFRGANTPEELAVLSEADDRR